MSMPNRNPQAANLLRFLPQLPSWLASYSVSDTFNYSVFTQQWRIWVSGTAVNGRYAVQGKVLMTQLPGLLHPIGPGWSYKNTGYTGAFGGGLITSPIDTPVVSISGDYLTSDPTNYPSVGGSGTLQFANDSRTNRLLRPRWVA